MRAALKFPQLPGDESELFCHKRIIRDHIGGCSEMSEFALSKMSQIGLSQMSQIALLDDDDFVRKALARLLSAHGLQVRTYASSSEFLDGLADGIPSCIIVDFHMPDRTGADLQRELLRRGIKIPTIVITARDSAPQREECRSLGAAACLNKPVMPQDLIGAINSAIPSR